MKECPVCKESFQDDLNFCDLDGSPLDGGAGNTVAGSSSKLWSFLGIGLLLAAVGITAGAIIFFPRGPSANLPASRSQSAGSGGGSTQPATAPDNGRAQADVSSGLDQSASKSSGGDVTAGTSADQARLASRKAALSKNDNSDPSLPNPKTVAGSDDDLTGTAKPAGEVRPRTATSTPIAESAPGARPASSDASGPEPTAKPSAASAAAKRRSRAQGQTDDAASGSKRDDKKKGGFLRVFKKIFGHG